MVLCKIPYGAKVEAPFNKKLNDNRKTIRSPKATPACADSKKHGLYFINRRKFTLTEQLIKVIYPKIIHFQGWKFFSF